jgi:extracellular factor (EF) 3-hydroxypalmitic acid methyl ester biosynthesis protein
MVLHSNEGVSIPHGDSLVERLLDIERRQSLSSFMEASRTELELFRRSIDATIWKGFVDSEAAANLRPVFLADPYTQRGLVKPRGYAGDAVLLDYIYETTPIPEFTSKRGSRIYRWMCKESKAFHAVRYRRELIAKRIDAAISANPAARILSIACGHLREFALCKFDLRKWNGELVALDQDPASLAIVANTYRTQSIIPTRASIGALVSGTIELGKFDLIYAAGLLDYLDDSTVSALTNWCRQSLNHGLGSEG